MKKPNLISLPALVLLLLCVSACKKSTEIKPDIAPLGPVKQVMMNGADPYYSFTYNSSNQLTFLKYRADLKMTDESYSYENNRLSTIIVGDQKTTFNYNTTGQVISTEANNYGSFKNHLIIKFTYNAAGKITVIDSYQDVYSDGNIVLTFSYVFEYNNQGLVSRIAVRDRQRNVDSGEFQFLSYSDTNIPSNPIVIDKIIFGFKIFNSVMFSQFTKLPTRIHYKRIDFSPYEYDETYEYTLNHNVIDNVKRTATVKNNDGTTNVAYFPYVFKY